MPIIAVIIGITAGIFGGLFGIGGAIVMIPALCFILKFDQHLAQGTTLAAMIPPIGILAAYEYYKKGHVNVSIALFIAMGFLVGSFFGAKFAVAINDNLLKKIFGFILLFVSIKMIIGK